MRVGLQIPNFTYPGTPGTIRPTLKTLAQLADSSGFYSLWLMDHFFQIGGGFGDAENEMLEAYSGLSYFAGLTENIKLGSLVTGVVYRYPGVLVKTVTTLDVLSGGRAYLGIGAAWHEREARGLGLPFPPTATRFEQLEETLQIALQMWKGDLTPYNGKHYQLAEPRCNPLPLSQPHPPIMIGGTGEKKTLRLVAQYADACNIFMQMDDETIQRKLDVLKAHCDSLGRPYEEIEKTALATIRSSYSPAEALAVFERAHKFGFTHVIFNMPDVHEVKPLEAFIKEVLPAAMAI